jgi:uncharacterized membrane protein YidH (DUF202 family)
MINKIKLNVVGGIQGASIVCDDAAHGVVSRQTDFADGEIITIPWSCGMVSSTVGITRIDTTILDNGDIREDVELENVVALLTFESGLTIMDVPETYVQADKAIAISASSTSTIGWSIGGVLVAICIIITALVLGAVCFKLTSGCLPVKRLFKRNSVISSPPETPAGPDMELALMHVLQKFDMAQHSRQTYIYPTIELGTPGTLVNTGGGVTPGRASAPVEVQVIGDSHLQVGTSRV